MYRVAARENHREGPLHLREEWENESIPQFETFDVVFGLNMAGAIADE
jgi:hypothetical protein